MKDGTNIFHYDADQEDSNETHYVLSSGFFSAIKSFTKETRSSEIDFFASKDEFFIFENINDTVDVVCIFSNTIEHNVGRVILSRIMEEIRKIEYNSIPTGHSLDRATELELTEKIKKIADSIISVEYQVAAAQDIFDNMDDIDLITLYDYRRDKLYFKDSILDHLMKEENEEYLLEALRSFHRYFMKVVKSLDIGKEYKCVIIETMSESIVLSKYRTKQTLCYSKNPHSKEEIYQIPFRIMSLPNTSFFSKFDSLQSKSKWRLTGTHTLEIDRGEGPAVGVDDAIERTIFAVSKLIEALSAEDYHQVKIYADDPTNKYLNIIKNHTRQEHTIEFYD